jgi:molecular chaperone GrpE
MPDLASRAASVDMNTDESNQNDPIDPGPPDDAVGDFLNAEAEIANLRAERQAFMEKLARVQADFTNSRRRLEADMDQRLAYANQSLIESLLPTLDNFDRALSQDPTKVDAATFLKGMELVSDGLKGVLTKYQVEPVAPAAGDDFDPNLHQAVMQQESNLPEGKVTMLLQKGYMMKGRIMRPAQVAVARAQ